MLKKGQLPKSTRTAKGMTRAMPFEDLTRLFFVPKPTRPSVKQLLARRLNASVLKARGFSVGQLVTHGYSRGELIDLGFGKADFQKMIITTPLKKVLETEPFILPKLRSAGYDALDARLAGASEKDCLSAGFSQREVQSAFSKRPPYYN
ncbi:MAG TPA: hypothetical protein VJH23_02370 [archaeon]|nr:hypothetical protein [archaeon]